MAGIYIHIPFCKQKCSYCDFHFSTTYQSYRTRMLDDINKELSERSGYLETKEVQTIYFGGGTPSLLTESELSKLIAKSKESYDVIADPEISLETNPDDITPEKLDDWKQAGINRLSIGIQSFKSADLDWMNRAHNVSEAVNCVGLAKEAGFENITVDLIYGLPDLTMEEWGDHIDRVIDMGVKHVSAYCLTIEPSTALQKWTDTGKIIPASEDAQSDQFLLLIDKLTKAGFEQYEISNFAKPGFESEHNSNYWKGKWYIGVGPSAHSFNGHSRSWNIANNQLYMKQIEGGEQWWEEEVLTKKNQFNELLLIGLRTKYGVAISELQKIIELEDEFLSKCASFEKLDWIIQLDGILRLTSKGRLKADHIASELFVD